MKELKKKYFNKKFNSRKQGINFNLSFEEYKELCLRANIDYCDIKPNGFHLARYNDVGEYSINNCRFITHTENFKERKLSAKSSNSSRINIVKYLNSLTPDEKKLHYKNASKKAMEARKNYSKERIMLISGALSKEKISQMHTSIMNIKKGWGFLKRASIELNLTPQYIGRFLKKYPI